MKPRARLVLKTRPLPGHRQPSLYDAASTGTARRLAAEFAPPDLKNFAPRLLIPGIGPGLSHALGAGIMYATSLDGYQQLVDEQLQAHSNLGEEQLAQLRADLMERGRIAAGAMAAIGGPLFGAISGGVAKNFAAKEGFAAIAKNYLTSSAIGAASFYGLAYPGEWAQRYVQGQQFLSDQPGTFLTPDRMHNWCVMFQYEYGKLNKI